MPFKKKDPELPPAGEARDEVLKQRTDALEAQAETLAKAQHVEAMDPNAFEVEREIAQHFDELYVTNAQPEYHYAWINFDSQRGIQVRRQLAIRGWQVVTGDMPEAVELRDAAGNRRLGDVILMRIPRGRWEQLEAADAALRRRQQQGITSGLLELGAKHRGQGVKVHTPETMPDNVRKAIENPSPQAVNAMRGTMAAQEKYDTHLRTGS